MADQNRAGSGDPGRDDAGRDEDEPRVVIRDKRKFDADGNRREAAGEQSPAFFFLGARAPPPSH